MDGVDVKPTRESVGRVLSNFAATPQGFSEAIVALWEQFPDIGISDCCIYIPGDGWIDVLSRPCTPEELKRVYRYDS